MNILIISNNLKGWTYETLYYEQQLLKKFGKFKYFFWGPGYNFDTNDFLEYEKIIIAEKALFQEKLYVWELRLPIS